MKDAVAEEGNEQGGEVSQKTDMPFPSVERPCHLHKNNDSPDLNADTKTKSDTNTNPPVA